MLRLQTSRNEGTCRAIAFADHGDAFSRRLLPKNFGDVFVDDFDLSRVQPPLHRDLLMTLYGSGDSEASIHARERAGLAEEFQRLENRRAYCAAGGGDS